MSRVRVFLAIIVALIFLAPTKGGASSLARANEITQHQAIVWLIAEKLIEFIAGYAGGRVVDSLLFDDPSAKDLAEIRRLIALSTASQSAELSSLRSFIDNLLIAITNYSGGKYSREDAGRVAGALRAQQQQVQAAIESSTAATASVTLIEARVSGIEGRVDDLIERQERVERELELRAAVPRFVLSAGALYSNWSYSRLGSPSALDGSTFPVGVIVSISPTLRWGPEFTYEKTAPSRVMVNGDPRDAQVVFDRAYLGWAQSMPFNRNIWLKVGAERRAHTVTYPAGTTNGLRTIETDTDTALGIGFGYSSWRERVGIGVSGNAVWAKLADAPADTFPSALDVEDLRSTISRGEAWVAIGGMRNRLGVKAAGFFEYERVNSSTFAFRREVYRHQENVSMIGAWFGLFIGF